jgi:hypothetical protein
VVVSVPGPPPRRSAPVPPVRSLGRLARHGGLVESQAAQSLRVLRENPLRSTWAIPQHQIATAERLQAATRLENVPALDLCRELRDGTASTGSRLGPPTCAPAARHQGRRCMRGCG